MFACSQKAPTKDAPINPKTGLPYLRGGPYKRSAAEDKAAAAQTRAETAAGKASEATKLAAEKAAKAKSEIERLHGEVARLTEALRASEEKIEMAKKTAQLEASKEAAEKLLQRYRDGLRDGASLSRGGLGSLSASTPDSSAAVGSSPFII